MLVITIVQQIGQADCHDYQMDCEKCLIWTKKKKTQTNPKTFFTWACVILFISTAHMAVCTAPLQSRTSIKGQRGLSVHVDSNSTARAQSENVMVSKVHRRDTLWFRGFWAAAGGDSNWEEKVVFIDLNLYYAPESLVTLEIFAKRKNCIIIQQCREKFGVLFILKSARGPKKKTAGRKYFSVLSVHKLWRGFFNIVVLWQYNICMYIWLRVYFNGVIDLCRGTVFSDNVTRIFPSRNSHTITYYISQNTYVVKWYLLTIGQFRLASNAIRQGQKVTKILIRKGAAM